MSAPSPLPAWRPEPRPRAFDGWSAPLPQRAPAPGFWTAYGRHLVLFLLTGVSIFLCAAMTAVQGPDGHWTPAWDVPAGLQLAVAVLSIMLAHEMGHYVACRYYGVEATLPFFIPAPLINPLVGTFGAVIRIKSPFPHRRALFDIGIAGPLAGFAVCLPVLWLGLLDAKVVPDDPAHAGLRLAEPLLFRWAAAWIVGAVPDNAVLTIGPLGMAAWFGLLLTGLNLVPIGQLDGGHVTYALFARRAYQLSRVVWWLCIAMIVLVGPSFILWAVLVRVLGFRHPPTLGDGQPVDRGRALVGLVGLAVFVVSFLPNPMLASWADVGDMLRELQRWLTSR